MNMAEAQTFAEWWPYYLGAHRRPLTRKLHFIGVSVYFLSYIPFILTMNTSWLWLPPIGLVVGYILSACTHWAVEKNHPNAKHPIWGVKGLWVMYGLMYTKKMDAEMIRVYGSIYPSPDAPMLIDPKLETARLEKMSRRISDEWDEHPFTEYFDIFLLKHQHPLNVWLHVFTMVWYSGCLLTALYFQVLWPLLFIIVSPLLGHLGHKLWEDNFVDPEDALASPRAMRSLWKMLWLWLTGRYWDELKKRQDKLLAFHQAKLRQRS